MTKFSSPVIAHSISTTHPNYNNVPITTFALQRIYRK